MVVFHHSQNYFGSIDGWPMIGETGVDIFFVISGFIMAYATAEARESRGFAGNQAAAFLLKRLMRVVPLYWIALLWTYRHDIVHGRLTSDSIIDFFFVPHFHHYFKDWITPTFIPGWTINYEIFFYAIFALAMLSGRSALYLVGAAISALVLVGVTRVPSSAPALFYTSDVMYEFVFGILLFVFARRAPRPLPVTALLALLAIGVGGLALESEWPRGLVHGIPALLVVYSFLCLFDGGRSRILLLVGDASYCIYLFHFEAFPFASRVIDWWSVNSLPSPLRIGVIVFLQIVAAVALGVLVHLLVEKPLLTYLRRHLARGFWLREIRTVRAAPAR